jgi:hypothetical protein
MVQASTTNHAMPRVAKRCAVPLAFIRAFSPRMTGAVP